jgi:hypothetical protein
MEGRHMFLSIPATKHLEQQIKSDKRLFINAAGNAQKAADFILGERESI